MPSPNRIQPLSFRSHWRFASYSPPSHLNCSSLFLLRHSIARGMINLSLLPFSSSLPHHHVRNLPFQSRSMRPILGRTIHHLRIQKRSCEDSTS